MAREGIDYPDSWVSRLGCGVKCSINKLYSLVSGKLGFINTVGPDTDGKVEIVSDTSNIIVTDDPSNHRVHLDLDAGLSSPPVTSVAGKTGAVTLDGDDVAYDANDTVNDKIDDVASDVSTLSGTVSSNYNTLNTAISTETANRQAQDALKADNSAVIHKTGNETKSDVLTLTSNPVVSNGFPGVTAKNSLETVSTPPATALESRMSFTDSSNNATGGVVTRHNTDGTRRTYLYGVGEDGSPASIDVYIPASGNPYGTAPTPDAAASIFAVTNVAYISDTTGLNNLLHANGTETVPGAKTFTNTETFTYPIIGTISPARVIRAGSSGYVKLATITGGSYPVDNMQLEMKCRGFIADAVVYLSSSTYYIKQNVRAGTYPGNVYVGVTGDTVTIWAYVNAYEPTYYYGISSRYGNIQNTGITWLTDDTIYAAPTDSTLYTSTTW